MPEPLTTELVAESLRTLGAAFPSRRIDERSVMMQADVYRNGLSGISGGALRWAVRKAIQDDEYFPKVARLRSLSSDWQKANKVTLDMQINRPSGWCDACHSTAQPTKLWRPAISDKGRRILDAAGQRLLLEQYERVRCKCDGPNPYSPDSVGDDYMTLNRQPAP